MDRINLKKYKILKDLGIGGFGEVKLVKEEKTGRLFAAKISLYPIDDSNKLSFRREMDICSRIIHPSIVQFYGYSLRNFNNEPKPVILMEYFKNKTLADVIKLENDSLSIWDSTIKLINIYGIASAMAFLHENNTIHRDLKPENILMDDNLFPKITDFGLAKINHQNNNSITTQSSAGYKGTLIYCSPEILENEEYSEKSDVYAYALIVYEIVTNKRPFEECKNLNMIYRKVTDGIRPEFDISVNESYKNLIIECWDQDPSNRPTFNQILDKLEKDKSFFPDDFDEEKYLEYIDYIKEFKKNFDKTKKVVPISDLTISESIDLKKSKKSKTKKSIKTLFMSKQKQKIHETESLDDKSIRTKSISTNKQKIHETEYIDENELIDSSVHDSLSEKDDSNIKKSTKLRQTKSLPNTLKDEPNEEKDLSKSSILTSTKNSTKEKSKRFSLFKKTKQQKNLMILPNDECNIIIREAEIDAEKQFFVAKSFIEEKNNFPLDIENGINYLKRSIKGGCIDAVSYYCQMLIKGNNIPKNLDKAKKTLKKYLKTKNSSILLLYGKVKKKEGDSKGAEKYFKKSSDVGNPKAMYNLAKLIFTDVQFHYKRSLASTYFKMAKNNGYDKYDSFLSKQSADSIYQFGILFLNKSSTNFNIEEAIKCFNIAIDKGSINAMIKLGDVFYSGYSVEIDKGKAFIFYSMAANNGDIDSMVKSANMSFDGDGIPVNKIDALKFYKMAANKGRIDAMIKAANMLNKGDDVIQSSKDAFNFYKMAADNGRVDIMFFVAKMLVNGDGIESNKKEAYKYFKMAADGGNVESMYIYGNALTIGIDICKNISEAAKYYKNAADKGHIEASFQYGVLLKNGEGIQKDPSKSYYYLKIAADKGHLKATIELVNLTHINVQNYNEMMKYIKAVADSDNIELRERIGKFCYVYGMMLFEKIPKNFIEGTKYIKRSVDIGCKEAFFEYACCLEYGVGIPRNTKEACKYFQVAINQNNKLAMLHYAKIQYTGDGVLMNKQEACKFFKMAADNGSEEAMYMYAKCLEEGTRTEINIEEALIYYKMALDNGYDAAEEKYKELIIRNILDNQNPILYQQPSTDYQQSSTDYQQSNINYQQQQEEYHPCMQLQSPNMQKQYSSQSNNQQDYQNEPLVDGSCTYNKTGENYVQQPFYACITCGLVGHLGCCEACAKICHAGHKLYLKGIDNCFCDCGAGGIKSCVPCKCRKIPANQTSIDNQLLTQKQIPPLKPIKRSNSFNGSISINYNQNSNDQRFDSNINYNQNSNDQIFDSNINYNQKLNDQKIDPNINSFNDSTEEKEYSEYNIYPEEKFYKTELFDTEETFNKTELFDTEEKFYKAELFDTEEKFYKTELFDTEEKFYKTELFDPNTNYNQNSNDQRFDSNINYNQKLNDQKIDPNINSFNDSPEEKEYSEYDIYPEEKFNKTELFDTEEKFYKTELFDTEETFNKTELFDTEEKFYKAELFDTEEKFYKTELFDPNTNYNQNSNDQRFDSNINYNQNPNDQKIDPNIDSFDDSTEETEYSEYDIYPEEKFNKTDLLDNDDEKEKDDCTVEEDYSEEVYDYSE